MLNAYLRTLAVILFVPCRASRGLVLPDHWYRSARWAVGHLILVVLAVTLLANSQHYSRWVVERIWPPSFDPPHMSSPGDAPAARMIVWFGQTFLVWAIVVVFPVGLGVLLSIIMPRRHRSAKLGGVKWSLYLSSLYVVMLVAWYGYYLLNPPQAQATFPMKFTYALPTPDPAVVLMVGVYGAWWAAGMAANPYNRVRGFRAFVGFALLYGGSWAIIARVLFPAGALDALL